MGFLSKINSALEFVLNWLCGVLLLSFSAIVLLQVVARNYLNMAFTWTIELSLMLFIWTVFMGAAVALRRRSHYIIELFPSRCVRLNAFLDLVSDCICFLFIYVLIRGGLAFTEMSLLRYCSSIEISQAWLIGVIPLSASVMALFCFENLFKDIRAFKDALSGEVRG